MNLSFAAIPLMEVGMRLSYRAAMPLNFENLRDISTGLEYLFPDSSAPPVLEVPPGLEPTLMRNVPFSVQYQGNSVGVQLTLHAHLVSIRWRALQFQSGREYPGYSALKDIMRVVISEIGKSLGAQVTTPYVANLFYVNVLSATDEGPWRFFSDTFIPEHMRVNRTQGLVNQWQNLAGFDFSLEINEGMLADESQKVYRVATAAGKVLDESDDSMLQFDLLHDQLGDLFFAMISDVAKREWGYTSGR